MARRFRNRTHTLMGHLVRSRAAFQLEMRIWDEAAPVGREFGSPDFERLMQEDLKNKTGVYSPEFVRQVQESLTEANAGKITPYQYTTLGAPTRETIASQRKPSNRK